MTRRIALLLGFLLIFALPVLAQKTIPALARIKIETIQWLNRDSDLEIVLETGEKYTLYLRPTLPAVGKENKENGEHQLVLFPYAYEAVLQQRFITMLSHKIAFSTNRYDEGQDQGEKKEAQPKHLEKFIWNIPGDNLSVEITPGIFKNGTILALDEKLKYSFDLKKDAISLEGSPSRQLDTYDEEMIKGFLSFLIIYARENIEWYEVEMSQELKTPSEEKKSNVT